MKRKVTHYLLVIILVVFVLTESFSQNSNYSKLTVSIDPMGLLFFGPALNVGYAINEKTVIKANVRRNSWGLLASKIRGHDPDKMLYKFTGMGYAIGVNRFVENIEAGYYYGGFLSIDIQNTKYAKDSESAWNEQTISYGLLANGGRRFKIGSQFYVNAGAALGVALVRWHWEYDDPSVGLDDPEARKGTSFVPIGGLELAFGIFLF